MLPRIHHRRAAHASILVSLVALAALVTLGCREARTEDAPVHLNPNMDDQKYLQAQDEAQITVDGYQPWADSRAMRPQVEGTVAAPCAEQSVLIANGASPRMVDETGRCDGLKTDTAYYSGKNADGSYAASLPEGLKVNRRLVERGKERYGIYCAQCHGIAGDGNGPVIARGMTPPPSYHDQTLRSYEIGRIFEIITLGGEAMPSLAAQVPAADRWAIATYVRSLQFSHNSEFGQLPEADQATVRGEIMGRRVGQQSGVSIGEKFKSSWSSLGVTAPAPTGGEQ